MQIENQNACRIGTICSKQNRVILDLQLHQTQAKILIRQDDQNSKFFIMISTQNYLIFNLHLLGNNENNWHTLLYLLKTAIAKHGNKYLR